MPTGIKHDEQEKKDAVAQFKALGGGMESAKTVAADFNVKPSTIYGWAKNGSKPTRKAKRKTARTSVKAKSLSTGESAKWETLYNDYIYFRDAAEAARKELETFVKGLK